MVGDIEEEPELGRVSARMDAEVRAEQAEFERMAARGLLRQRTMPAVARELMVRGDEVEVGVGGLASPASAGPLLAAVRGTIVHAAGDLAILRTTAGRAVDLRLGSGLVLRVVRRTRSGGVRPGRGAASFAARMTEHEIAESPLTLVTVDGGHVDAVIEAVGRDHLWLRGVGDEHLAVPHELVTLVLTAS